MDGFSVNKECDMNWDQVAGKWQQLKGGLREQWGHLTDDDIDAVAGQRDQLLGKLQERYGVARDEADKQVTSWMEKLKP
jgi:uncharacterized protein YjbJ (UPF0337 family)